MRPNTESDFWSRVSVRGVDDCWEWTGSKDQRGYGRLKYRGRHVKAHRLAWELTFGAVPSSVHVRHKVCDNPPCCNPAHLAKGTNKDNMNDRDERGRTARNAGEKCGRAKLTWAAVREIRRLRVESGLSHRKIASQFGVAKSTVTFILSGNTWKAPHA